VTPPVDRLSPRQAVSPIRLTPTRHAFRVPVRVGRVRLLPTYFGAEAAKFNPGANIMHPVR